VIDRFSRVLELPTATYLREFLQSQSISMCKGNDITSEKKQALYMHQTLQKVFVRNVLLIWMKLKQMQRMKLMLLKQETLRDHLLLERKIHPDPQGKYSPYSRQSAKVLTANLEENKWQTVSDDGDDDTDSGKQCATDCSDSYEEQEEEQFDEDNDDAFEFRTISIDRATYQIIQNTAKEDCYFKSISYGIYYLESASYDDKSSKCVNIGYLVEFTGESYRILYKPGNFNGRGEIEGYLVCFGFVTVPKGVILNCYADDGIGELEFGFKQVLDIPKLDLLQAPNQFQYSGSLSELTVLLILLDSTELDISESESLQFFWS
ncbi:MAG: hypothetical protein EZS28_007047, partial [Streblomastix strix]